MVNLIASFYKINPYSKIVNRMYKDGRNQGTRIIKQ